jgi:IS4 transposase
VRSGPKNLRVSFCSPHLTRFAGVYLLHGFLRRLDLKRRILRELRLVRRNARYSVAEELLALLYPMMLGIQRIEATHLLQHNGVFQYLTALPTYPDPTTLRRFLIRQAPRLTPRLRRLHDQLLARMIRKPAAPTRWTFDLDSTVLVLYGHQQGGAVGYNPVKPGRRSYHPLLCFDAERKDFWHGELRPGDRHTAFGGEALLAAVFAKLPPRARHVLFRADKGFFSYSMVETLEAKRADFILVARLTRPIQRRLSGVKYRSLAAGIEVGEFRYQPHGWPRPYRFVVIRRALSEESSEQLTLLTVGRYTYQVFVTNQPYAPATIWSRYNGRAAVELILKELKADYPLTRIPTGDFAANETYFHVLLLAYNLAHWFQRLCLPPAYQSLTLKTLITTLLMMPGELVYRGNRPVLKLPANAPHQEAWKYALKKISHLKI